MTTIGTIYGNAAFGRVHRSLAAAAYNGVKVDVVATSAGNGDGQKPEYLEKFPHVSAEIGARIANRVERN